MITENGYVEIDGGTLTEGSDARLIGTRRYFVTLVSRIGERCCVWDGPFYSDALTAATEIRSESGLPLKDLTGETTGAVQ